VSCTISKRRGDLNHEDEEERDAADDLAQGALDPDEVDPQ